MQKSLEQFYRKHLPDGEIQDNMLTAKCPFCHENKNDNRAKIVVFLNPASFFYGYFRCLCQCVAGGFHHWFAHLAGIDPTAVPGLVEEDALWQDISYPERNINTEIDDFQNKLHQERQTIFDEVNLGRGVLQQLRVGYNGRYLVYPYVQTDGNVYSARCVHPQNNQDYFWYGDTSFGAGFSGLFNVEDIQRCTGGTLFLCEGEENLLIIKKLGFPGVAFAERKVLEELPPDLFASIKTLFIVLQNTPESFAAARQAASRIGYKVRIIYWKAEHPREYTPWQFALDTGGGLAKAFGEILTAAKPFSPFATPAKESEEFFGNLEELAGEEYGALLSGFPRLDARIDGIHGINILGGGPKVGKSCFMTQIATELASRRVPVLYYDFENGRQRLYQRTYARMARIETSRLTLEALSGEEKKRFLESREKFERMLRYFRVINDRKVSPQLMRRHIDFLRHETRNEFTVVVIDSLHKLPFKDLQERRSGIDAWLRQMEAIRDELNVAFLVVSELLRGESGDYGGRPHIGVFKGSGDIEYSADNAMVLLPEWDQMQEEMEDRVNSLWLVGSREHSPGLVGQYLLDYPYWGFREQEPPSEMA